MSKDHSIIYFTIINLEGVSGKSKATREKVASLNKTFDNFVYFSRKKSYQNVLFAWIIIEIKFLIHIIFRARPQLVICRSYLFISPFIFSKIFQFKLSHEIHADFYDESKILYRKRFHFILYSIYLIQITMLKYSDYLFFNNIILLKYYRNQLSFKKSMCLLLTNGTDTSNYRLISPILYSEISKKYSKYFLFIGNASVWHNIESIIFFFNSFCQIRNDFKLLIVGGSSSTCYYNQLKEIANDNDKIIFIDKVSNDTAIKFINASKFVLIPSSVNRISPGSPLKLYDCCACGKPLIVQSDLSGYSDVVNNFSLGIAVDFNHPSIASRSVLSFITNIDYNKLSNHNRNVSIKFFDWDICYSNRIKNLMDEI